MQVAHKFVGTLVINLGLNDDFERLVSASRRGARLLPFGICSFHPSYGEQMGGYFLPKNESVYFERVGENQSNALILSHFIGAKV